MSNWFNKSKQLDFGLALHGLGIMYNLGQGVNQDTQKTIELFQQAINKGVIKANYGMGYLYFEGKTIPQDYQEAIRYLKIAAAASDIDALNLIAIMYRNGLGVKTNKPEGLKYWIQAAELGSELAQFNLAKIYLKGIEKPKNKKEAIRLLELSAQKNNPLANDLLGEIYNETITIKGDIKKALANYGGNRKKSIEHSKIAAKNGIFSSQSRLAYFHYTNALLAKSNNYVETLKWMNIVASQKPGEMNTLRHQLLKEMPPEDIKQAEKLADICLHTNFKDCD